MRILRHVTLLILCCVWYAASGQKIYTVEGSAVYNAPPNISREQANKIVLDKAKIKAIESKFGTNINSQKDLLSTTVDGKTQKIFHRAINSSVNAEWIETIDEKYELLEDNGHNQLIKCTVKGKVREGIEKLVDFKFAPLRLVPDIKYANTEFENGDDLFLYFNAPVSGYLNVFLLNNEEKEAQCLLPYYDSTDGAYYCEQDKDYYFFSPKHASKKTDVVDEYSLTTDRPVETNELVLVFSKEEFNKTSLNKKEDLSAPKSTTIEKFNEWLSKLKSRKNYVTSQSVTLTIKKNQ